MFDLGWSEFLIIGFVLMMVVGPKDLPKVLRTFSRLSGQARSMAREFTSSLEDASKEGDMKEVKKFVTDLKSGNLEDMATIIDDDTKNEIENIKSTANVDALSDDVKKIQADAKQTAKNEEVSSGSEKA